VKAVLWAITKLPDIRERSVVKSSVIASVKYSCSGSFDRFSIGRTTIERRGTGDNRRGLGFLAHLADEANAFARFERVAAPQFATLGVERMIPKTELQARTPRAPIAPALLAKLGKSKGYLGENQSFRKAFAGNPEHALSSRCDGRDQVPKRLMGGTRNAFGVMSPSPRCRPATPVIGHLSRATVIHFTYAALKSS